MPALPVPSQVPKSVLITSGESSGELYGSMLARELKKNWQDIRIFGIGGKRMQEAGVEVFAEYSSAIGLVEALSVYKEVKKTLATTIELMERERPEVVVLIDYPDFNFRVGLKAKELGLKVLYYVSPQIWAWRGGRINTMKKFIDQAAVLLPFEEQIYADAGIPCEFVGHPIMEEMSSHTRDRAQARLEMGLDPSGQLIALLPGSRPTELRMLLPVILDSVRLMKKRHPQMSYVLSVAPNIKREDYKELLDPFESEGVAITDKNVLLIYSAADAAIVASGTAALQGVFRGTPLVVIYKASLITYILLKMILNIRYANLANIILDQEAVPELLQGDATAENIVDVVTGLLEDSEGNRQKQKDLDLVREMFKFKRPTRRVAEMVGTLARWSA